MAVTGQVQAHMRTADEYIRRYANNAQGQVVYEGVAEPGTAVGTAGYRLIKYVYDSNGAVLTILFADGDKNFDNTWSGRASKTYS